MRSGLIGPPLGVAYQNVIRRYLATGAVVRGQIVEVDLGRANAGTLSNVVGARDSCLARILNAPTSRGETGGCWVGVAMEDAIAGIPTPICLSGDVFILCAGSPSSVNSGDALFASSGNTYLGNVSAAGKRCHALAIETVATPTGAKLVRCLFEGRYGWNTAAS